MATDPRAAFTTVTDGPADLIGDEVMVATRVFVDGMELHLPKALPGVLEYVTVAHAEHQANELRPTLWRDLDYRGPAPYQPDATRVFEFLASAGTAVASAATGLEAFANHHLARICPPPTDDANGDLVGPEATVPVFGEPLTFRQLTDKPLNERLGKILPELTQAPRPTSEPWWPKLRQIQTLAALNRHGITDPVRRKPLEGVKSLVQRLCDREYAGAAAMMLKAFEFISPGWIGAERAVSLPRPPDA
jgi:hypothetical protein